MSGNPGGWPTGPLLSEFQYDRRDLANAVADLWEPLVVKPLTPVVAWLARQLDRLSR